MIHELECLELRQSDKICLRHSHCFIKLCIHSNCTMTLILPLFYTDCRLDIFNILTNILLCSEIMKSHYAVDQQFLGHKMRQGVSVSVMVCHLIVQFGFVYGYGMCCIVDNMASC